MTQGNTNFSATGNVKAVFDRFFHADYEFVNEHFLSALDSEEVSQNVFFKIYLFLKSKLF